MRHNRAYTRLGRNSSHRKALLRNLAASVITYGRVETTLAKAKAIRPVVEKLITFGKRGDLHALRTAFERLPNKDVVGHLFNEVAPRYADRQGGYTRIMKTGFRKGDNAEMAIIELIGIGDQPAVSEAVAAGETAEA